MWLEVKLGNKEIWTISVNGLNYTTQSFWWHCVRNQKELSPEYFCVSGKEKGFPFESEPEGKQEVVEKIKIVFIKYYGKWKKNYQSRELLLLMVNIPKGLGEHDFVEAIIWRHCHFHQKVHLPKNWNTKKASSTGFTVCGFRAEFKKHRKNDGTIHTNLKKLVRLVSICKWKQNTDLFLRRPRRLEKYKYRF